MHQLFHGDCTNWRLWIEDIQLAAATVRNRHPGTPVYLVGISWGGKTALGALVDDRDGLFDGGILIAPAFKTKIDPGLFKKLRFAFGATFSPDRPLNLAKDLNLDNEHYSKDPKTHDDWLQDDLLVQDVTFRFLKESNSQISHALKRVSGIRVPVLALFGTCDHLVKTYESDQALLPLREDPAPAAIGKASLTTVLLKELTHASVVEDEELLAEMIRRWIEGKAGATAPEGELWMPAHATGFGVDEKGRSSARGRKLREAPRGFSAGIEVTAGKPITIRRDPRIPWQDRGLKPATMTGNSEEGLLQKLVKHSMVLRSDENDKPLPYFAFLALVQRADGTVTKSAVRFNDNGVARWTPPATGKLSFLANDATVPPPSVVYTNNTGTLRLTIEP